MKIVLSVTFILMLSVAIAQPSKTTTFSGKITDTRATALPGVTVYLLNTSRITITDEKGAFQFQHLPEGKYTVQFTAVGFATINKDVLINALTAEQVGITLIDAAKQLDAVMVSAQKREEFLQQVPFSITALSAKQVQQYRLWNTKELTAITPNLFSSNSGDDRNVTSIRGITTTSYEPAVATYIDGVNQFSLDTYIPHLADIERIEILRGPQGTLYGRNAMGGVINIITKQPTDKQTGFAEINIGNYGQQRYIAGIRSPLVKGKLYAGAAAMYSKGNGFYSNDFNNTSFDKQNSFAGNYFLKLIASDRWSVILNGKHAINRNNGAFPMVNGVGDAFANPFHLNQNATAKMIDNTFNSSLSRKESFLSSPLFFSTW